MSRLFVIVVIAATAASPASAEKITLSTGEVLSATLVSRDENAVVVDHPILGRLTLPAAEVTAVVSDEQAAAEAKAAAEQAEAEKPKPAAPAEPPKPTGFFAGWEGAFEAGLNVSRGNSETLNLVLGFDAKKENELHRWKADVRYFHSRDEDEITTNEFTAGLLKDWLVPDSPWFYFVLGRYTYDEFQDWQQRVSGTGGVGYQWIDTDELSVLFRGGAGGTYEFGNVNEFTPEALLGGEFAWKISDAQSLEATTYYFPDLGEFGEARITSTLGYKIKISQLEGISLKIGLANEYETTTEDDSKHNDLKLFTTLSYEF